MLREANMASMNYHGFVEGDDIGKGTVDVVVTEGFAGNIALKTAEGTARQFAQYLRAAMNRTWMARLGYLLSRQAFQTLREKMDPRKSNGGVFLGLNGVVIKSHGGADARAFSNAIGVGLSLAASDYERDIVESLAQFSQSIALAETLAETGLNTDIKASTVGETLAVTGDKVN